MTANSNKLPLIGDLKESDCLVMKDRGKKEPLGKMVLLKNIPVCVFYANVYFKGLRRHEQEQISAYCVGTLWEFDLSHKTIKVRF